MRVFPLRMVDPSEIPPKNYTKTPVSLGAWPCRAATANAKSRSFRICSAAQQMASRSCPSGASGKLQPTEMVIVVQPDRYYICAKQCIYTYMPYANRNGSGICIYLF